MNVTILIGRLTKNPELKEGNTPMTSFTIAVDREGKSDETDFPRVTVFGKQAENCVRYLSKGSLVAIRGVIRTGQYTDRDGKTVYTTDVVANRVQFLSPKNGGESRENDNIGYSYGEQSFFDERPF